VTIPKGTTLSIQTAINTTTLEDTHISLQGTIKYLDDLAYWGGHAFPFAFQNISSFWLIGGNNIVIDGGGTIDGNGQAWWDAFPANASLVRPIPLTLYLANNVLVHDINLIQSPFWFHVVHTSKNVEFSNLSLNVVSNSTIQPKNTDGWDIYRSDNVVIRDCTINNTDDCVSFKPNSTNIFVSNLHCNGSHGVSVGSLGQYPQFFDIAQDIHVQNVVLSNTQNGVRVKVFAGPGVGSGMVNRVTYENIVVENVDNPLIFDQCYETSAAACAAVPSRVGLTNIFLKNITGTSSGAEQSVVADLECSPGAVCTNIVLDDFHVVPPPQFSPGTTICQNFQLLGNAVSQFNCTNP